jgi:hypothetical protein
MMNNIYNEVNGTRQQGSTFIYVGSRYGKKSFLMAKRAISQSVPAPWSRTRTTEA